MHISKVGRSFWLRFAVVLGVCVCSFFVYASSGEITLMEARNFVAAREMVAGGSWLLPTMNGELRLAKPPFPTWCVAGIQLLTGTTQQAGLLRLPSAVAATLLVFFFWGLGRELTRGLPGEAADPGRTAWIGALVLASSLLVIQVGREGQWDIFAHSWLIGGLWLLLQGWRQQGKAAVGSLLGAGVLVGLSFLSKGPVALYAVLLPFLITYLVGRQGVGRQQIAQHAWATGGALVLAVLISASWPLYIWCSVAPIALEVARTEIASWSERHSQPFWYYWSFFAFTGPWAFVALTVFVWPYARLRARRFVPYIMLLGWLAGELLLLSIIPEKKERYMLPLMFPLALLVSGLLRYWESSVPGSTTDKRLLQGWGGLLLLVLLGLPFIVGASKLSGLGLSSARFIVSLCVFGGLAVWVFRSGVLAQRSTVLMVASFSGMCAFLLLLLPMYPVWKARNADLHLRHIGQLPRFQKTARWYSLDAIHIAQVWRAGRTIPVWHPTIDSLISLQQEVVVLSMSPVASRLPSGWKSYVTITSSDSFYLDKKRTAGYWFISSISPTSN